MNSEGDDYWANVGVTNTYLGGKDLNVKNLIMTNGSEVMILIKVLGPLETCIYFLGSERGYRGHTYPMR